MNIETVKEFESSYLVNDSISVPKDSSNRDCVQVEQWILDGGEVEQEDLVQKAKDAKCAEICTLRDQKILEDSIRKSEADDAQDAINLMTKVGDIESEDITLYFS